MDENRRKRDILINVISRLKHSNLRRRRLIALIHYYIRCNCRRIQEHRNFLRHVSISIHRNVATCLSYLSAREPTERKFWLLPRPQYWFETMLERRDLDYMWAANFRVNRQTFMKIVEIVRPHMTTQDNTFRQTTIVEKKVAAALW